ncbi:MAG TPA: S41 family peptidase [Candidatus Polarisedimenticolaceae bacterium]|nr:S41 family peptidase [Candidatus Polarisedimenticolaceae bacterium]
MLRSSQALAVVAFAVALGPACRAVRGSSATGPDLRAENAASFDRVWTTVRDRHWDPTLGGLDWEAVRAELRPRAARARTREDARPVLSEALARLGQSHFAILPAEASSDLPGMVGEGAGAAGLSTRILDGRATVSSVLPGSPADRAGVRPGWIERAIDGKAVAPELPGIDAPFRRALQALAVDARWSGPTGKAREGIFEDGTGQEVRRTLLLEPPAGTPARLGWLPTQYLRFDRRTLDGGVGYVHFNVFLDPPTLMPAFEQALQSFREAPGLVLDLRGNIGGIGVLAMGIGGWLVAEPNRELGTMTTREGALRFVLHPRTPVFDRPLAVLVDEVSISTAEILAGGLQDLGRAQVFGSRSAGAALPSAIERLPNGDAFQYAFANYVRTGGEPLEGRGVRPDVEAPLTREALLAGRDPALEAALTWIRSQAAPL